MGGRVRGANRPNATREEVGKWAGKCVGVGRSGKSHAGIRVWYVKPARPATAHARATQRRCAGPHAQNTQRFGSVARAYEEAPLVVYSAGAGIQRGGSVTDDTGVGVCVPGLGRLAGGGGGVCLGESGQRHARSGWYVCAVVGCASVVLARWLLLLLLLPLLLLLLAGSGWLCLAGVGGG